MMAKRRPSRWIVWVRIVCTRAYQPGRSSLLIRTRFGFSEFHTVDHS
jgi:hypothetical protein